MTDKTALVVIDMREDYHGLHRQTLSGQESAEDEGEVEVARCGVCERHSEFLMAKRGSAE